jgi:hypothetical protein
VKSGAEKNLLFLGLAIFALVVIGGLNLVDGNLTRLMVPESPYLTASVSYDHGIVISGPERKIRLGAQDLVFIASRGGEVHLERGPIQLRIPYIITLGGIEKIRDWVGLTN